MVSCAGHVDSVMEPKTLALAEIYAEALLGLLESDERAESAAVQLEGISGLLDEIDDFETLITTSLIDEHNRHQLLQRIFSGWVDERVEAFLGILSRHGRMNLLRAVAQSFRKLLNIRQGRQDVTVTSAFELNELQRREVIENLRTMLKSEPILKTHVDESLLGGLVVQVGDKVFDTSVASRLNRIGQQIMNRVSS